MPDTGTGYSEIPMRQESTKAKKFAGGSTWRGHPGLEETYPL